MQPLKISSFFDPPSLRAPPVPPARRRGPLADDQAVQHVESVQAEHERRVQGDRRLQDRREKEQSLFLDTRTGKSRRRSPGRRAEDQANRSLYLAISVKA